MVERVESQIARIKKIDEGKQRKKIVILGAGMAGLAAAYEMADLKHEVIIYEASNRIGGRAWTHRFKDGQYHEFGAMRFLKTHDYTRRYASICGLQFRRFVNHHGDKDSFYLFRGILCRHSEWEVKLLPELNLTEKERWIIANGPITEQHKDMQLLNLLLYPLSIVINEIDSNPFEKRAILGHTDRFTARVKYLDRISLREYLSDHIESDDGFDILGAISPLEGLWDKAVTFFIREEIIARERLHVQNVHEKEDSIEEIIGGTDLLPNRLFDKIKEKGVDVKFGSEVYSIFNNVDNVQLKIKNGSGIELVDCDYVLCTIPFPVLRRMELFGLSFAKMRAIRNLEYASATKVLINTKNRFWETDEHIFGGASQIDMINRQVIYPSDNVDLESTGNFGEFKSVIGQVGDYLSKRIKDTEASNGPGVLVGSYCWGQDARRLGVLDHDDRATTVIDSISEIHPQILSEGIVKDYASMYWDSYKYSAGGFSFMKPGDYTGYYFHCIQPEGNLFFAGEHCSLDNGWIQGAVISALNAVELIVNK